MQETNWRYERPRAPKRAAHSNVGWLMAFLATWLIFLGGTMAIGTTWFTGRAIGTAPAFTFGIAHARFIPETATTSTDEGRTAEP